MTYKKNPVVHQLPRKKKTFLVPSNNTCRRSPYPCSTDKKTALGVGRTLYEFSFVDVPFLRYRLQERRARLARVEPRGRRHQSVALAAP